MKWTIRPLFFESTRPGALEGYLEYMARRGWRFRSAFAGIGMFDAALDEDELARVRNTKLGFVFQDFMLLDGLTVRDNILLPRIIGGDTGGDMEQTADQLCQLFGIAHIQDKYPAEISGGEKQRTAVARALINHPLMILADEPTGNLDSKSGDVVISTMTEINKELGKTIVMVTHDPKMASYCSRLILLKDGVILEDLKKEGDQEEFYQKILVKMKEL